MTPVSGGEGATRRTFLTGLAALGATALASGCRSATPAASVAGAGPHRIDVHHHILPPRYLAAAASRRPGSVPEWSREFATDTTRTIASLLFSGTATRFRDVRFIFSHGGGTMPFLTGRFMRLAADRKEAATLLPAGPVPELRRFYYELAQAAHPMALAALLKLVPVSQVLLGTDFPFRPGSEVLAGVTQHGFGAAELRAVERENALALLPTRRTHA